MAGLGLLGLLLVGWAGWGAAGLYVEWAWFESLGHSDILTRQLTAQALLLVTGALVFGLAYFGSLRLALHNNSGDAGESAGSDGLWTYLARVSAGLSGDIQRVRRVEQALRRAGVPLALLFGLRAAGDWNRWLAALYQVPFGLADPLFGRDIGWYVFWLPVLRGAHGWAVEALLVVALATLTMYLARSWFELRLGPREAVPRLARSARLHLAALLGACFLLIGAAHQLGLAEVVFATTGHAFRMSFPGYVEVVARAPLLGLAMLGALVAAGGVLWAARGRSARRFLVGPAIWAAALVLAGIGPAAVQALVVKPNEAVVERPYLTWVGQMARAAYGLDRLVERSINPEETIRPELAQANLTTLGNVRLWEPEQLRSALNQLQAGRPYYGFQLYPDVVRYQIGGQARTLMVAVRELDPEALRARSWVNTRLQFTHGYGLVAAAAGAVGADGRPILVERDMPPRGELGLTRPEIYFGERTIEPALVRTTEPEIDYPRGEENVQTRYQGRAGVSIGSLLARLAHAIRLRDPNLVLSPAIGPDTTLLHRRQIVERVQRLAPFLVFDPDPYPIVSDGRLVWMLDGYTATDRFPFSPRIPTSLMPGDPRPDGVRGGQPNALRGAVKATVDAYDGAVSLYVIDAADPIAASYARAYPGLLRPGEALPEGLRIQLRYPQQLFRVQADLLARLHSADPGQLYSGEDAWLPARGWQETRPDAPPVPAYALQRLPGDQQEEFALTVPFRPYSPAADRHNVVALLAARSDPDRYGELVLYRYPKDRPVEGPFQADLRIDQDPTVSAQFGLWRQSAAQPIRGEVQTVLLGSSIVYIQSVYLQRPAASLPELQRVVAVAGGRVVMEPTLDAALGSLFGVSLNLALPGGPTAPVERPPSARELALSAQEHLRRAQAALLAGDRTRHDQEIQAAQTDLQRLAEATR